MNLAVKGLVSKVQKHQLRSMSPVSLRAVVLVIICSPTIRLPATPLVGDYRVAAMAVDPAGNIWLTGRDHSGTVPVTSDAIQRQMISSICGSYKVSMFGPYAPVSCNDAFIMKLDPSGTKVLYATYLGGRSDDGGLAIAVDQSGSAYIAGYTTSLDFPVSAGAFQTKYGGGSVGIQPGRTVPAGDVFLTKLNADGTLIYSTFLGGSDADWPWAIRVDSAGNVYVAGSSSSRDFPLTPGAFRTRIGFGFVAKLNQTGSTLIYGTHFDAYILAFTIDASGAAYLTGFADSSLTTTPGAFQSQFTGALSTYVSKVDPSGKGLIYSTYLDGGGHSIAVDSQGAAWVAGSALIKLAPNGSAVETTARFATGAHAQISIPFVALDGQDNAYAMGNIWLERSLARAEWPVSFTPTSNAGLASACSGLGADFLIQFNPAGRVLYASYARRTVVWGDMYQILPVLSGPGRLVLNSRSRGIEISTLDLGTTPARNFGCPVNSASFSLGDGVVPGEIVSLFGYGLGPDVGVSAQPDPSGRFPSSLSGVQVLFDGRPAPVLYAQSGQVNAVVPTGPGVRVTNKTTVEVQYNGQSAPPLDVPITSGNPGVFTLSGGAAAILNQDGKVNSRSNPAKLGSTIVVFSTGLWLEDTANISDGEIVPAPPPFLPLQYPPRVSFAGVPGVVMWAGAAPGLVLGVIQINVRLPSSLPPGTPLDSVPLIIEGTGYLPPHFSPPVLVTVAP